MPAQLIAVNEGIRILLDKPILLMGRDSECDIQFESRKISRRHCCIAQVGDRLIIRDLGSTNGIRINGVRVAEGYLKAGDELTIGNHRYRVSWEAPGNGPSLPRERRIPSKELAPAGLDAVIDDVALESCEEPVLLTDPAPQLRPPPREAPPTARPEEGDVSGSGPLSGSTCPPIVPEHLELAPSSDHFTPPPPPPTQGG
jgi:pSer/pThr/pTyr-binding forkhead associated (FHA) protein